MPLQDVLTALTQLQARNDGVSLARDYHEGRHRYPYATPAFRKRYAQLIESSRLNLCRSVVASFTDLVKVKSWYGNGGAEATDLAERHGLMMPLSLAVREAWTVGDGWVLAWPGKDGQRRAWSHRADQVAFEPDPDDPAERAWVAKRWVQDRHGRVNVYYPDRVERWVTAGRVQETVAAAVSWPMTVTSWLPYTDDTGGDTITHDYGTVPWAHLPLDPTVQGGHGRSVLTDVIPAQDWLNHSMHAALVNTEDWAAPIRALMNVSDNIRIDPNTGEPEAQQINYDPTKSKMFGVRGPGPLVQLDPPDSSNLLTAMDAAGAWVARIVGIPVSDIVPDLGNIPSGAALRTLANRRTNSVRDFTALITPEVSRLLALLGVDDAYPSWRDPAPKDETEELAEAQTRADLGWSLDDNLREMGYDVDDRARITAGQAREQASIGREALRAFRNGEDPASLGA